MKKINALALFILGFCLQTFATHNRAGEITYKYISGLQYEVTITTYTDERSSQADRAELTINWGDGQSDILQRSLKLSLANNIQKNEYKGNHTYAGPGSYIIWMEDPNRVGGIQNIAGSINVPFYIQTTLVISTFNGVYNNSPVLTFPPIDNACLEKLFIHNPGAVDQDGDSLSYALIPVRGENGNTAPGYNIPPNVSINPVTGDMIWNTPQIQGEYNFAIEISEWRKNGNRRVKIGYVVRDLQVTVGPCVNEPPVIAPLRDTCIEAGTNLKYPISASDPDGNPVTLAASGSAFSIPDPAIFPTISGTGTVKDSLRWQTNCSHVRESPYSVFIRASDNGNPAFNAVPIVLSDYKSFNITVVGPSPKNPVAAPQGNDILIKWSPSICTNVTGYQVYRKMGSFGFVPSHCETGVPAYTGFSLVGNVTGRTDTSFLDPDLIHGQRYCYMIVAVFPDGALSYASEEICAELKKDVPIITNISVSQTATTGEVELAWSAPTELDTIQFPGPYSYLVYRSAGLTGENLELIHTSAQRNDLFDTIYVDSNVNTVVGANSYRIDLLSGNNKVGHTYTASSVFLTVTPVPAGNALDLTWEVNAPWTNYRFDIFRLNPQTNIFDSIGFTNSPSFKDTGLVNGDEYCYYVRSVGEYTIDGVVDPIVNLSQRKCGIPEDIEPPCPPVFSILPDCNLEINTIRWSLPPATQTCRNDAAKFTLYFTSTLGGEFAKAEEFNDPSMREFVHQRPNSIAGCYYLTATDEYGNETAMPDTICVDNCPLYELPNVFTPDGDKMNDFFRPFPYKFVESIDIQIFNRWGQVMYDTKNPNINWNGVDFTSKEIVPEGVYFYVCTVNEIKLVGIVPRTLQGHLSLFRKSNVIPQIPD